jgi:hypothetical protein
MKAMEVFPMNKNNRAIGIQHLSIIGLLAFLLSCSLMSDMHVDAASKPEEKTMTHAPQMEGETPTIPPIDAQAPAIFETASFGLG